MNLSTIVVPEEEAKAKLAEYEAVVREERTAEDDAIAQAYRAASRGLPVIRLTEVIAAGGTFADDGLPRLAIARAGWRECHVRYSYDGPAWLYGDESWPQHRGALVGKHTVRVPIGENVTHPRRPGRAPVPLIPPRYRPRRPRWWNCHILWELDAWQPDPARDPALIRHIRGDLWTVLAVWDLTDLERAVLAQRST
jgi:hypothetical protein